MPSRDIVENAWKAFATHDPDRISAVFTEDAEWPAPPEIVQFLAEDFPRFLISDVTVRFTGFHTDGDRLIVEETMTAT